MEGLDVGLVVNAISCTTGLFGLVIAGLANKRAKEANRQAKDANDIAARSLVQAQEANRIAEEGNETACDANAVAERALAATTDHVQYAWRLDVQEDDAVLVNDSAHPARDVTVVVDERHRVVATAVADDIPPFGELGLELQGTFQQHLERVRERETVVIRDGIVSVRAPYRFVLRVTVTAFTEAGVTHSDVIKQSFGVRQGKVVLAGAAARG